MSDRELIEAAKKYARGGERVEKLREIEARLREAMEEYVRAAMVGALPEGMAQRATEDVVREAAGVWAFFGSALAHSYLLFRLLTGSFDRALKLLLQFFSPSFLSLIGDLLRDTRDIDELVDHFRRRGDGGERD